MPPEACLDSDTVQPDCGSESLRDQPEPARMVRQDRVRPPSRLSGMRSRSSTATSALESSHTERSPSAESSRSVGSGDEVLSAVPGHQDVRVSAGVSLRVDLGKPKTAPLSIRAAPPVKRTSLRLRSLSAKASRPRFASTSENATAKVPASSRPRGPGVKTRSHGQDRLGPARPEAMTSRVPPPFGPPGSPRPSVRCPPRVIGVAGT